MARKMEFSANCDWNSARSAEYDIDGNVVIFHFNMPQKRCDYVVDFEKPFSSFSSSFDPKQRIYASFEPSLFTEYSPDLVMKFANYYQGKIFSWHKQLSGLPQTRMFHACNRWARESNPVKKFGLSGYFSSKNNVKFDGYGLRHKIISSQHQVRMPGTVFNYTKSWRGIPHDYPQPNKNEGMNYMFHLAVENCRENGYFTEKVIDCFANKVVPLYFGDPDIGKYFDMTGIILIDHDNFLRSINSLTVIEYDKRKKAVEENFERSKKFWSIDNFLGRRLLEEFL